MKYILFLVFSVAHLNAGAIGMILFSDSVSAKESGMAFSVEQVDLGDLRQGKKAEHIFEFTNTGNKPLIIHNVISTCGCTIPQWTKKPVMPGEKGTIKVLFDSAGKIGRQNKLIIIRSNLPGPDQKLRISAMVLPPE